MTPRPITPTSRRAIVFTGRMRHARTEKRPGDAYWDPKLQAWKIVE